MADPKNHPVRCTNPKQGENPVLKKVIPATVAWHRAMKNYSRACGGAGLWYEQRS